MSLTVSLPCEHVTILGRHDQRSDALAFDWTNSGVYLRFRGNKITFHFDVPALSQELYLKINIDGYAVRLCVNKSNTAIEVPAKTDGEHTVYCVRTNEILDAVPLVMRKITLDGCQPALLEAPSLPARRMLFIGDSITCGFGILTKGALPRFTTSEQDGSKTYAALTAAHFGAQAHFICISGRGIARNCDNLQYPLIPEFFEQTTISNPVQWDHSTYSPDVIVINAGTNDTAGENDPVDHNVFKSAAKAFVKHLLTVYPHAKVLWCYGMMTDELSDRIRESIEELQTSRVSYLPFTTVWAHEDERGACQHPNVRAHYRCAGSLIPMISELTGWDL